VYVDKDRLEAFMVTDSLLQESAWTEDKVRQHSNRGMHRVASILAQQDIPIKIVNHCKKTVTIPLKATKLAPKKESTKVRLTRGPQTNLTSKEASPHLTLLQTKIHQRRFLPQRQPLNPESHRPVRGRTETKRKINSAVEGKNQTHGERERQLW